VAAERALEGRAADAALLTEAARAAAAALSPDGDIHATAAYRRRVAAVLAERTLTAALARCGGSS
jgi:carbon-monoxide dehydrogenase medium subunit